jgi:SAM-dependent methyltransferase
VSFEYLIGAANEMNTNVSELTRATERPEAISMRVPVDNPSKTKTEEIWNENYSKYGVAFGSERSQTAVNLIEAFRAANGINRRKTVVDVGCGTGRDAIEYALQGYEVTGIDLARSGLELAFQEYCVVQQRHPISGVARFLQGDIETAFANIVGNFDGISSHRTLHLMQRGQLKGLRSARQSFWSRMVLFLLGHDRQKTLSLTRWNGLRKAKLLNINPQIARVTNCILSARIYWKKYFARILTS